tara:strand:- start:221 stop:394 length:174 start_codon:yes stop_codon:yes gene_type:complete
VSRNHNHQGELELELELVLVAVLLAAAKKYMGWLLGPAAQLRDPLILRAFSIGFRRS